MLAHQSRSHDYAMLQIEIGMRRHNLLNRTLKYLHCAHSGPLAVRL